MAWNLAAVGEATAEAEQKLHDELVTLLGKAEYGATGSSLHGETVSRDPLHADAPAAPEDAAIPEDAPAA
jgi:hypothetical protein